MDGILVCYIRAQNSCYLNVRILTEMHRVLCLFLRGLFNDAPVSQNMRLIMKWKVVERTRSWRNGSTVSGFVWRVCEIPQSLCQVSWLGYERVTFGVISSHSEVSLGNIRATSSLSRFMVTGNRLLAREQVAFGYGEDTVGEPCRMCEPIKKKRLE
jgi:hypothetical protein